MYRKIGEVFEFRGVRHCIEDCIGRHRGDDNEVIFKKSSIFPKLNFTTNCKVTKDCAYRNNKTGDVYTIIEPSVIEATNSRDGEISVLYKKANSTDGKVFVREICEFVVKFTEVIDK